MNISHAKAIVFITSSPIVKKINSNVYKCVVKVKVHLI